LVRTLEIGFLASKFLMEMEGLKEPKFRKNNGKKLRRNWDQTNNYQKPKNANLPFKNPLPGIGPN